MPEYQHNYLSVQRTASSECSLSRGSDNYIVNLAVLLVMLLVIIATTIYLIRFNIRMRRTTRYFINTLYQQDNMESHRGDSPFINGYTINMSKEGNASEMIGPKQRI